MEALLHLPEQNATLLTAEELAEITGAKATALQVKWLRENGWKFTTTRHDEPRVGRLYANLKLAGLEMSDIINNNNAAKDEWTPNGAAIGS